MLLTALTRVARLTEGETVVMARAGKRDDPLS